MSNVLSVGPSSDRNRHCFHIGSAPTFLYLGIYNMDRQTEKREWKIDGHAGRQTDRYS